MTPRELLLAITEERQRLSAVHQLGAHDLATVAGCPYCYPPGPNFDYRPGPRKEPP